MRNKQKEPHSLQSLPTPQVFTRGDVQIGLAIRTEVQLVQDTLLTAGAATSSTVPVAAKNAPITSPSRAAVPPHLFPGLARPRTKEEMALLGLDEYKPPCSGSPDSHRSGSSPKLDDKTD